MGSTSLTEQHEVHALLLSQLLLSYDTQSLDKEAH